MHGLTPEDMYPSHVKAAKRREGTLHSPPSPPHAPYARLAQKNGSQRATNAANTQMSVFSARRSRPFTFMDRPQDASISRYTIDLDRERPR